jgi:hypothetical protein
VGIDAYGAFLRYVLHSVGGTGCDAQLLRCCKGHQAHRVRAFHVNGPTGTELEGILSAARRNAGYVNKTVLRCCVCVYVVESVVIEARYRYAGVKLKLSMASICLAIRPWCTMYK